DAHAFADDLNRRRLPGVHFRPACFVPTFHKWAGRLCGGVQIHVTHAASFKPFITGLAVVASARRLGATRIPLAAAAVRVRAPEAAVRHPVRDGHGAPRDRARRAAGDAGATVAAGAGTLARAPGALASLPLRG